MTTQLVGDRQLQIEEILGAFNLTVGGTFSGVAHGGTFIPGDTGATIETRDPSTGAVLAHVRTASEADCSSAIAAALEAFKSWRCGRQGVGRGGASSVRLSGGARTTLRT